MEKPVTPANYPDKAQALIDAAQFVGGRGWAPATGGNFSVRVDGGHCMITQSGCDKSRLSVDDLMLCDLQGQTVDVQLRPSAELALHTTLYQLGQNIGAVLHSHSVISTVLSRATVGDLIIQGFEMQKALSGNVTHQAEITVPIFENNQDIAVLAKMLRQRWQLEKMLQPGFLVRGHGLYAWSENLQVAKRNLEGFEFLFACAWQEKLLQSV